MVREDKVFTKADTDNFIKYLQRENSRLEREITKLKDKVSMLVDLLAIERDKYIGMVNCADSFQRDMEDLLCKLNTIREVLFNEDNSITNKIRVSKEVSTTLKNIFNI